METYICYYASGDTKYTENAAQHALDGAPASCQGTTPGYAVGMQYDLDGNLTSETHHFGQTASSGAAGITQKFYDGADRLVEVIEPTNDTPFNGVVFDVAPWLTRYLYDLSQNGSVSMQYGSSYGAHGGLYKTQRYLPGSSVVSDVTNALLPGGSASWGDVNGSAFDALDRKIADYRYAPAGNHLYTFDTGAPGLLVSEQNALNDTKSYQYDADGNISSISFAIGSGSDSTYTAGRTYTYDPDGRLAEVGNPQFGNYFYGYDADGRMTSLAEPTGGSGIPGAPIANSGTLSAAATITNSYYGDGMLNTKAASGGATYSESHNYRADGLPKSTLFSVTGGEISWGFTAAGRILGRQDPAGAETYAYDSFGRKASVVVPSGTRNGYQYDAEDNAIQFTGPGLAGAARTFNIAYTATGEIGVNQDIGGGITLYLDGAPIQFGNTINFDNQTYTSESVIDTRNLLVSGQALENSSGTVIGELAYPTDAAGRVTQLQYWQPPGSFIPVNQWTAGVSKFYYYDAEDHLTRQTSFADGFTVDDEYFFWGPAGRAIVGDVVGAGYRGYHWDGTSLAFTSLQSGSVNDYKLGSDGDFLTADTEYSGAIYYDRNDAGYAIASHDAAGYSDFCAPAGEYAVGGVGGIGGAGLCSDGTASGKTPAFYTAGFGPDLTDYPSDGVTDGYLTLQGARNYEVTTGQWTTPDAYEGDISDPMSQAKYMWDRNNPIAYSDPSGFCATRNPTTPNTQKGSKTLPTIGSTGTCPSINWGMVGVLAYRAAPRAVTMEAGAFGPLGLAAAFVLTPTSLANGDMTADDNKQKWKKAGKNVIRRLKGELHPHELKPGGSREDIYVDRGGQSRRWQ